jgi:dienelactone hydrolase
MRLLEFLLLAVVAIGLACHLRDWQRAAPTTWLFAVAILLMVAHLAIEGYRWQMVPVYLATGGALIALGWLPLTTARPWLTVVGLGLLSVGALLCLALPVFTLPAPSGPYPVGSTTRLLRDSGRQEPRMGLPGARREVLVQIWYPAERQGRGQPYRPRAETIFTTTQLALVTTHSAAGVPVSRRSTRYPVILFSPSWPGRRAQNTVLAEELASRGFLVVAIDHPFGSAAVAFPDGRVIHTTLGEFLGGSTVEAVEASYQQALDELERRTADARFVLDEIGRLDADDPEGLLTGRVGLNRVGMMGYSFGGAVAAETAFRDDRIQAVLNLDGTLFGESATHGIAQPYFFVTGRLPDEVEPPPTGRAKTVDEFQSGLVARDVANQHRLLTTSGGSLLQISGTTHLNFSDGPLYSPLQRWRSAGRIDPLRALIIVNEHTVQFFRQNLDQDATATVGVRSSKYPEARFETWAHSGSVTSAVSAIGKKNP